MYENNLDIRDKIFIIKHSNLDDATILNANYSFLIHESDDAMEQEQLTVLKTNTQLRIKELT